MRVVEGFSGDGRTSDIGRKGTCGAGIRRAAPAALATPRILPQRPDAPVARQGSALWTNRVATVVAHCQRYLSAPYRWPSPPLRVERGCLSRADGVCARHRLGLTVARCGGREARRESGPPPPRATPRDPRCSGAGWGRRSTHARACRTGSAAGYSVAAVTTDRCTPGVGPENSRAPRHGPICGRRHFLSPPGTARDSKARMEFWRGTTVQ